RIIAYGLLMVLVGVGIVSFPYLKKLYTYQRAKSALAAGRSEEALKRFAEITDFRNSEEFIREARFESILTESRKQIDRSDFEGALANLKKARSSFAEKVEIVPMIEETSKRMIMNAVEGEKFKTALGYREEFRNEFPASARELDGDLEDWFAAKTSTLDPKSDGGILLAILSEQYRFFPDDPDILRRVAAIKLDQAKQLLTKGDVDKAYSILRELDARYPGHGEIQKLLKTSEVKRVTASSGSKSVGYRIKELTDVLDKYPDSAQVRKDLVDLYLEQGLALDKEGEEKQARRVFKRALEITPNDERLISAVNAQHLREAGNLLSNKRFREAERELNAVRTVDTDLKKAAMIKRDLSVSEVRQIIKRNNFDMAAKRLEMLVDRYPKDREIPDLLKQVKIDRVKDLFDQGQYEDSIEEFKKLAEEYPSVSFDEEITQAKLEIASAYFRENRYLDAYRLYKEVLSSKPDDRRAIEGLIKSHFKAGQLYLEKKDFDKAMSEFQTVLKFDKNFSAAKAGLAESCLYLAKRYIKAGRLTEARQYVDASLRVFPDNEEAVSLEQIIRVKEMEKEYQAVGNPYIRRPAVEPGFEAEMLPGKPGTKPPRVQPDGKEEWRVMFSAIDQTGDDRGDGNYIYPIHDAYEPGAFDIVEFKVLVSSAQVAFKVRLKKDILKHYRSTNTNSDEREQSSFFQTGEGGWIFHMFDIYIDMDNRTGSGRREALPGRNVIFKAEDAWEKVILVSPENRSSMERTISHKSELPLLAELRRNIELPTVVFVKRDTFEVRIPIDAVGFPSSEWKYQILMMGYTRDDLPTSLRTIEVQAHADNNHFGGGSDYHGDSNVIDLLNPLGTSQFTMLSDYVSGPNRQKNRYPEIRMVKR
ncbi:MAG: glucodextranase DOMON-like domain-containing protein, partial [bacterium]|nr:glucodextranase DOMON-like domain-containing protein [bacterium]